MFSAKNGMMKVNAQRAIKNFNLRIQNVNPLPKIQ
jgi:hypothetical protein